MADRRLTEVHDELERAERAGRGGAQAQATADPASAAPDLPLAIQEALCAQKGAAWRLQALIQSVNAALSGGNDTKVGDYEAALMSSPSSPAGSPLRSTLRHSPRVLRNSRQKARARKPVWMRGDGARTHPKIRREDRCKERRDRVDSRRWLPPRSVPEYRISPAVGALPPAGKPLPRSALQQGNGAREPALSVREYSR